MVVFLTISQNRTSQRFGNAMLSQCSLSAWFRAQNSCWAPLWGFLAPPCQVSLEEVKQVSCTAPFCSCCSAAASSSSCTSHIVLWFFCTSDLLKPNHFHSRVVAPFLKLLHDGASSNVTFAFRHACCCCVRRYDVIMAVSRNISIITIWIFFIILLWAIWYSTALVLTNHRSWPRLPLTQYRFHSPIKTLSHFVQFFCRQQQLHRTPGGTVSVILINEFQSVRMRLCEWNRLPNLTYSKTPTALDMQNEFWCVGRCQLNTRLGESWSMWK